MFKIAYAKSGNGCGSSSSSIKSGRTSSAPKATGRTSSAPSSFRSQVAQTSRFKIVNK